MDRERLEALEGLLGHRFGQPTLLELAVTHPSAAGSPNEEAANYERLEFLGDRVLGLITAKYLYSKHPQATAGELARRFNARVRRETLVRVAEGLGLGDFLVLSKSERKTGGKAKPAILADACEAVIAALYLDGGLDAASRFIEAHWREIADELGGAEKDAKTALQEWAHKEAKGIPDYVVVAVEGPPHAPEFTVEVTVPGMPSGRGTGSSKRTAEQAAAIHMLELLERQGGSTRRSRFAGNGGRR